MLEVQDVHRHWLAYWDNVFIRKPNRSEDDEIRDFVSKLESVKVKIVEEDLIPTPTGNLKSDLVLVKVGRVQVVDVTVRHENTPYLDERHRSKVEKYKPLLQILA